MDINLIIYALNLAAIYSLMAIGISLLWSSVGMINMAHGATFVVSGYSTLVASSWIVPIIKASLAGTAFYTPVLVLSMTTVALLSGAIFGAIIYLIAFLPLHDKPNFAIRSLIATLAINIATVQLFLWWFGPRQKALPKLFGFGRIDFLEFSIRYDQAATIVGTLLLVGSMLLWFRNSRLGLEIRAMMQNPEGAALSGISIRKKALPVMMLTGSLAGMAAILLSQTSFLSPTAGALPLIKGLTIALLGGLGSIGGAMLGALLIGILEVITGEIPFLGQRYVLLIQFIFIVMVLIVRPRGLGGLLDETRK